MYALFKHRDFVLQYMNTPSHIEKNSLISDEVIMHLRVLSRSLENRIASQVDSTHVVAVLKDWIFNGDV